MTMVRCVPLVRSHGHCCNDNHISLLHTFCNVHVQCVIVNTCGGTQYKSWNKLILVRSLSRKDPMLKPVMNQIHL